MSLPAISGALPLVSSQASRVSSEPGPLLGRQARQRFQRPLGQFARQELVGEQPQCRQVIVAEDHRLVRDQLAVHVRQRPPGSRNDVLASESGTRGPTTARQPGNGSRRV
ncbi:hypothetical protein [Kibdelosporangium philippinense]|uniref:hypothetical protein n=1 Tax=Kibdelosporangium philippinense TaxID=211113 RepID=UPI00361A1AA4